jgi:hypothetical protein
LTDALKYANRNRLSDNMVCDLSWFVQGGPKLLQHA